MEALLLEEGASRHGGQKKKPLQWSNNCTCYTNFDAEWNIWLAGQGGHATSLTWVRGHLQPRRPGAQKSGDNLEDTHQRPKGSNSQHNQYRRLRPPPRLRSGQAALASRAAGQSMDATANGKPLLSPKCDAYSYPSPNSCSPRAYVNRSTPTLMPRRIWCYSTPKYLTERAVGRVRTRQPFAADSADTAAKPSHLGCHGS